jgi:tRNA threonylcarbamoyladenosine biosynthesis protein TsaE
MANPLELCSFPEPMSAVVIDVQLPSAGETELLGAALARSMPTASESGATLYLKGDLGAGKTTCVRALLRTLGVVQRVRSPTYTLLENYAAAGLTCVHADLYRLNGAAEAELLGLSDLSTPSSLLLVEWPEKGGAAVPRPDVEVCLAYQGAGRSARLSSQNAAGEAWLKRLQEDTKLTLYVSNIT